MFPGLCTLSSQRFRVEKRFFSGDRIPLLGPVWGSQLLGVEVTLLPLPLARGVALGPWRGPRSLSHVSVTRRALGERAALAQPEPGCGCSLPQAVLTLLPSTDHNPEVLCGVGARMGRLCVGVCVRCEGQVTAPLPS